MITLLRAMALTGGEWVIYVLLLCSIGTIAVIVERTVVLIRERKELDEVKLLFIQLLEKQKTLGPSSELSQRAGFSAKVLSSGLAQVRNGTHAVEEHITSATFGEKQRLERRMIVLGTLGNNAVYIGLFGTVLGVIKAFHDLAEVGSSGPEVVMQGLSQALLATAVGLLVALPCVIAYNIFQKRIKDILTETEALVRLLLGRLKSES